MYVQISLPAWLAFPDVERVGWINSVVQQLWPHVTRAVEDVVAERARPLLESNKPRWLGHVKLSRFTMGQQVHEPAERP